MTSHQATEPRARASTSSSMQRDGRVARVVQDITTGMSRLLRLRSACVYAVAGRELRLVAGEGATREDPVAVVRAGDPSIVGQAWQRGDVVRVPLEAAAGPGLSATRTYWARHDHGGLVAAPLAVEERVVGVLALAREPGEDFGAVDLETIAAMRPVLARALENAQLVESERREAGVLERVRRASLAIAGCDDVSAFLKTVAREVRELCTATVGGIGLVDEEGFGHWSGATATGELGGGAAPVALLALGMGGAAWSTAERFPALRMVPAGHPAVEQVLAVPLVREGETLGVAYAAAAEGTEPFDDTTLRALQLFTEHAATVLRLLSTRERLARELENRDRSQARVSRSEQLLAAAQQVAGVGSWAWDLASDRIECSPGLLKVLRRRRDQAPADLEQLLALAPPADRPRLSEAIMRAMARDEGGRFVLEHRALCGDGTLRRVRSEGIVMAEHGRPAQVLGTMTDVTEAVQAQEALREKAETLRLMIEQAPIGTALSGIDGRFEQVNRAYTQLTGYSAEELLKRTFFDITHPDDRAADAEVLGALLAGLSEGVRREKRYVRPDGSIVEALVHVSLVRDAAGKPLHFVAQVEDLRLDRSSPSARAAEQRSREILDLLPFGVFVHVRGRCVAVNRTLARLRGVEEPRTLVGADVRSWVHPDDLAALAVGVPPREAVRGSVRVVRVDGSEVGAEARAMPVKYGSTEHAVLVVLRDRSEEDRTARARDSQLRELAQDRRWLDSVIERIPVAVLLVSADGHHARGNRAAEELLSRPIDPRRGPEQYEGQVCDDNGMPIPVGEMPSVRAARGEATNSRELVIRRTDGRLVQVRASAAPVRDEHGALLGGVAVFEDVTRERELLREREEWITVVSHDLRQPVTVIMSYADLLSKTSEDPAVAARLRHVMASARRLERMIADLLDMSRLEAHRLQLRRERVKPHALLATFAERVRPALRRHELLLDLRGGLPDVFADPSRIEQVLDNLLTNAAKYGAPDRPIILAAGERDGGLLVTVENEGEGIAPDHVPLLFRRFHRAVAGPGEAVSGLGLGLYIAHGLVGAHGGRIWAESERPGRTRFSVWLPPAGLEEEPSSGVH